MAKKCNLVGYIFLMRYNSESLEIKVVISGNSLLFKAISISLGLLITVRECSLYFGKSLPLQIIE